MGWHRNDDKPLSEQIHRRISPLSHHVSITWSTNIYKLGNTLISSGTLLSHIFESANKLSRPENVSSMQYTNTLQKQELNDGIH